MVDVEVDRASMKFQLQTVNYVHFFIEAASIKSSKNLVQNKPTASSFLSHICFPGLLLASLLTLMLSYMIMIPRC